MSDIEQRAWVQKNDGKKVGPWRGRVIYFYSRDSVFVHVDGRGAYPFGDNFNVSFPKKEYLINEVYDFYGTLVTIAGDNSGCLGVIFADARETNVVVQP